MAKGELILLIEDDRNLASSVIYNLENEGYSSLGRRGTSGYETVG